MVKPVCILPCWLVAHIPGRGYAHMPLTTQGVAYFLHSYHVPANNPEEK
jgi:hypothetical protein